MLYKHTYDNIIIYVSSVKLHVSRKLSLRAFKNSDLSLLYIPFSFFSISLVYKVFLFLATNFLLLFFSSVQLHSFLLIFSFISLDLVWPFVVPLIYLQLPLLFLSFSSIFRFSLIIQCPSVPTFVETSRSLFSQFSPLSSSSLHALFLTTLNFFL